VIKPKVNDIGPVDFEQRNNAILEGEKAALAAMPQIRAKLAQLQQTRLAAQTARTLPQPVTAKSDCKESKFRLGRLWGDDKCGDEDKTAKAQ
jgi:NTE family protein